MVRFLLGVVLGIVLAPLAVLGWFRFGQPPVAVSDPPLPFERQIVNVPMQARIKREMISTSPVQPDENDLVAGAQVYSDQCSSCHGFYGKPSSFAAHMYPRAPQLWQKHRRGTGVGVSDDPAGETAWKVDNGIRLTGMPAFKQMLSDTQIWQVSVLLANADKPLPPAALDILRGQQTPPQATAAPAKKAKKP
jgi:mono/diheme cytochrome c family protein